MHAIELMEVGKCFSLCSATEAALRSQPRQPACQAYWLASRYRVEHWHSRMQCHVNEISNMGVGQRLRRWQEITPLLQEILLSEPLTRCVAHHALVLEELGIESELQFVAKSVLDSHLSARQRCLRMLVFGYGIPVEISRRLNHIRSSCEAYSDHVRSFMPTIRYLRSRSDSLSFQPEVTKGLCRNTKRAPDAPALNRLQASWLSTWFLRSCALDLDYQVASARHNLEIAESLTGMFGPQSFDGFGVMQSPSFAKLQCPSSESSYAPTAHLMESPALPQTEPHAGGEGSLSSTPTSLPYKVKALPPTSPLDALLGAPEDGSVSCPRRW